jgi:hypothetical protein
MPHWPWRMPRGRRFVRLVCVRRSPLQLTYHLRLRPVFLKNFNDRLAALKAASKFFYEDKDRSFESTVRSFPLPDPPCSSSSSHRSSAQLADLWCLFSPVDPYCR